jgi:hypothetical protein
MGLEVSEQPGREAKTNEDYASRQVSSAPKKKSKNK